MSDKKIMTALFIQAKTACDLFNSKGAGSADVVKADDSIFIKIKCSDEPYIERFDYTVKGLTCAASLMMLIANNPEATL